MRAGTARASEGSLGAAAAPDSFRLVTAVEDRLPPGAVVEIPAHCLLEPGLEGLRGMPTELLLDLRSVNGVPSVMSRTVRYEGDQAAPRRTRRSLHPVEQIADRCHDMNVGSFITAAYIVGLADAAAFDDEGKRTRVVFDIEPVPDVSSVAIDRQLVLR